jgi:AcrR family transcriptional regulator
MLLAVPTADDARELASRSFLAGERLDMGALAAELGVNRVTLYRWVGSKELLLGDVISALGRGAVLAAHAQIGGSGAEHVARVIQRCVEQIHAFEPMRAFLARDTEYALRVLTSAQSTVHRSSVAVVQEILEQEIADPPVPVADLAYVIVRIGDSFLYRDQIIGEEPDVARVGQLTHLLLTGSPLPVRPRSRRARA